MEVRMKPNEEYVTVSRAREILGVQWRRMTKLTREGVLPKIKHPSDERASLIAISDIRAYQEATKNIPKPAYRKTGKTKPRKTKIAKESTTA
jgi:hypothetical protein